LLAIEVILEILFVADEIQFVLSVEITDNVLRNCKVKLHNYKHMKHMKIQYKFLKKNFKIKIAMLNTIKTEYIHTVYATAMKITLCCRNMLQH